MALKNTHLGWIGEHFAKYIISKFAFIAQPATIGDDIGADIFCTVFKQVNDDKELQPQSSFAIQIKTINEQLKPNKKEILINNKLCFLEKLELPYFVGAVDITRGKLELYSGESIPHFFSLYGNVIGSTDDKYEKTNVYIKLIDDNFKELITKSIKGKKIKYFLNFPRITSINSNFDLKENVNLLDELYTTIFRLQKNISRRISDVYLYEMIYGRDSGKSFIIAGPGSVQTYRKNIMDRLTESFYNLKRIIDTSPNDFNVDEFKAYERFYLDFTLILDNIPTFLKSKYEECKMTFDTYVKINESNQAFRSMEPTLSNDDSSIGSSGF